MHVDALSPRLTVLGLFDATRRRRLATAGLAASTRGRAASANF